MEKRSIAGIARGDHASLTSPQATSLAARQAGQVDRRLDVDAASAHLLGVVLGIRVLARTGAKRKLLESVARPALALFDAAAKPARRSSPRRA